MKKIFLVLIAMVLGACSSPQDSTIVQLANIDPKDSGVECGLAAGFCGVLDGRVVMVGGANFPDVPASEGGVKAFYSGVYCFVGDRWAKVGELESGLASAGCVVVDNAMYIVGGVGAKGAVSTVQKLTLIDGVLAIEQLPQLPYAIDQCGVTIVGSTMYLMGGNHNGLPSRDILTIDIENPVGWSIVGELPKSMLQPVVVSIEDTIYIWGGFSLHTEDAAAEAFDYGYSYLPSVGDFNRIKGAPSGNLTGSSAVVFEGEVYVVGGVNKSIFERAITRRYLLSKGQGDTQALEAEETAYMNYTPEEFKFSKNLQVYNPTKDDWVILISAKELALAGAGVAILENNIYVINGELMPGVRTNRVSMIKL